MRGRRPGRLLATGAFLLYTLAAQTTFQTTVPLVVAPVSVTDRAGAPVDGLQPEDFQLLVDNAPRRFDAGVTIHPVALAVAVQTGGDSAAALTKVRPIGAMIQPLITGLRGLAAVVAHDSEIRVLQDFTADPDEIGAAFQRLWTSSGPGRMLDAAAHSIAMLARRAPGHRRVLLLIGESRDGGSESRLEDVLTDAQIHNVAVYAITWSAFASAFAAKPGEAPPQPMNLFALFSHLRKQSQDNAAEEMARYTGGRRFSFVRQGAIEEAITAIGEDLHSQYLLSFEPLPGEREGFHTIQVRVPSRPQASVRTRPGYWLSPPSAQTVPVEGAPPAVVQ